MTRCLTCGGRGGWPGTEFNVILCSACEGTGEEPSPVIRRMLGDTGRGMPEPCSYCLGAPWCPGEAECGAELDQPALDSDGGRRFDEETT